MARAFGLPGNRGGKAHSASMYGHVAGTRGWPRRVPTWAGSKACMDAYNRGYDKALDAKEDMIECTAAHYNYLEEECENA